MGMLQNYSCQIEILETIQLCQKKKRRKEKEKMSSSSFKKINQQNLFTNHIYLIYLYKQDLSFNNLQ